MLIAAISGRALAQTARRAGYLPLTADFFCDLDTREEGRAEMVEGNFWDGFALEPLRHSLERLAVSHNPIGVVYGGGFERNPDVLRGVAECWSLIGNDASVVARIKDPIALAALCKSLVIPHPETQEQRPSEPAGWLVKRRGGAGGSHVHDAVDHHGGPGFYYQRRVDGMPISALFLADGAKASIIGFSRQWSSPTADQPYRYGGAIRPADIAEATAGVLVDCVQRIAAATGLKGLNSADFLVGDTTFHLIEVNPRPGATIDIHDGETGWLFSAHVAACRGTLAGSAVKSLECSASCVVYADRDVESVPAIVWPEWALDRQAAGSFVKAGWPLCTVTAKAPDQVSTMTALAERENKIKRQLGGKTE